MYSKVKLLSGNPKRPLYKVVKVKSKFLVKTVYLRESRTVEHLPWRVAGMEQCQSNIKGYLCYRPQM